MASPAKPQIHSHRDLIVWQRAMQVVKETYRVTTSFPTRETYGLVCQMRRAAVSIPANIAEGQARRATRDYLRFLGIANGSLRELETYCELSMELEYLGGAELAALQGYLLETGRMLMQLRQAVARKLGK